MAIMGDRPWSAPLRVDLRSHEVIRREAGRSAFGFEPVEHKFEMPGIHGIDDLIVRQTRNSSTSYCCLDCGFGGLDFIAGVGDDFA